MFLDPDLSMNPHRFKRSVGDAMREWETGTALLNDTFVQWGQRALNTTSMIFLTNTPWRDDLPNAGLILVKSKAGEDWLSEWWNYDIPEKDTDDFHEQDALWHMLQADSSYQFAVNRSTATLIFEPLIISPFLHIRDMWALHLPNYEINQLVYLRNLIDCIGFDDTLYGLQISKIEENYTTELDTLDVADNENKYYYKAHHRTKYPAAMDKTTDALWHEASSSTLWSSARPREKFQLTSAQLLDGFTFRLFEHREIFLVVNGSRHVFLDMERFSLAGFTRTRTFHLGVKGSFQHLFGWFDSLPEGSAMPQLGSIKNLSELTTLYFSNNTGADDRWFYDFPPIFTEGSGVKLDDHRAKEIFYVANKTRHSIPDWDTFQSLPFSGPVSRLRGYQLQLIPEGKPMPKCC